MDTFIPSIIPEPDHHLLDDLGYLPTFYPTHLTITHDLTSLSIRRRRGSVLDHFGFAFIHLSGFRFDIFHDGRTWLIVDLLVTMFSLWQLACWVLFCLLFAFWALIIIVVIHQLVLFCQHGVTIHGPVWHYLFEVGHFHYMMDEHISEYNSFETHFYLFSIAYWGIPTSPKASDLP